MVGTELVKRLAEVAWSNVREGYYSRWLSLEPPRPTPPSLKGVIERRRGRAVIAEVKYSSPISGRLVKDPMDPLVTVEKMLKGGAAGLSILTEPQLFNGDISTMRLVANEFDVPLLMKDVIVSPIQIEAGRNAGASAVLLIMRLFDRGFCGDPLEEMISRAKELGLEVVLETHGVAEFERALDYDVEMIGINNRDLDSFTVSLDVSSEVLRRVKPRGRLMISESGISTASDIRRLREAGADAFLVGTSIMTSSDIEGKVRELVEA
ncbi:MAG: indole-3-glycerol-phosphate synthase [Aigarchaeota archaeon]|nr:indole-3-glycerol-phosphate synthase [Aigarchaeota archaeon]MDW8092523.1 indole-3-glycerol-phosphate synthase [Nitrososphaerota archaeon]